MVIGSLGSFMKQMKYLLVFDVHHEMTHYYMNQGGTLMHLEKVTSSLYMLNLLDNYGLHKM